MLLGEKDSNEKRGIRMVSKRKDSRKGSTPKDCLLKESIFLIEMSNIKIDVSFVAIEAHFGPKLSVTSAIYIGA